MINFLLTMPFFISPLAGIVKYQTKILIISLLEKKWTDVESITEQNIHIIRYFGDKIYYPVKKFMLEKFKIS